MQRAKFFEGVSFLDVSNQISAFFVANAGSVGVSIAIQRMENKCQAILLYTP